MTTADDLTGPFFHGGVPGLRHGDLILSPAERGADRPRPHRPAIRTDDYRPDLVYVTTSEETARLYAAGYPGGTVYAVNPVDLGGEFAIVGEDPTHPGYGCYLAHRAEVLEVIETGVTGRHVVIARTPTSMTFRMVPDPPNGANAEARARHWQRQRATVALARLRAARETAEGTGP